MNTTAQELPDECRNAFEKWFAESKGPSIVRHGESYKLIQAHYAWQAWKAAWQSRAPHPDNGEVVEGLDEAIEWMQLLQGPKDERLEPDQSKVQKVINAAKLWAAHQRKVGG